MENDDREGHLARELIEGGSDIAGATAGGALGTIGGPIGVAAGAVGGVVVARTLRRLGAEVYERVLGPRQRVRVGAALAIAWERIEERRANGETPRDDGFFESENDGRAPAEELLEGVLLHAANEPQERKVPYLGALFASIAFRPDISPAYGHFLIRVAERLTYRQLQALAYFAENSERDELVYLSARRDEQGHWPFTEGLGLELDDLGDLGLLGLRQTSGEVVKTARTWNGGDIEHQDLGQIALMPLGRDLYELMQLSRIPAGEKEAVLTLMERDTRGNPGATDHPETEQNPDPA